MAIERSHSWALLLSRKIVNINNFTTVVIIAFNVLLILGVSYLVFITGGTKYAYLHLMYLPIMISGIIGGAINGWLVSIFAGVILALMPHDVEANLQQPINSIATRLMLFNLIGIVAGLASNIFRNYINDINKSYLHDFTTNLLNFGGLAKTFEENIAGSNKEYLCICVEISNGPSLQQFLGYNNYSLIKQSIALSMKKIAPKGTILGLVDQKTFVLIIKKDNDLTKMLLSNIKKLFANDLKINGKNVITQIIIGAATYPNDSTSIYQLINNAKKAVKDAVSHSRTQKLFEKSEQHNKLIYNLQHVSLLKSVINSGNIDIKYQPILTCANNKTFGFEAKIQWPEEIRTQIKPNICKNILDEMHSMRLNLNSIIFHKAAAQIAKWQSKKTNSKIVININGKDLLNKALIKKFIHIMSSAHIASEQIVLKIEKDYEIHAEQLHALAISLNLLQQNGVMVISYISLLSNLLSLTTQNKIENNTINTNNLINFVAIGKNVINNAMFENSYLSLLRGINKLAHETGIKTIAFDVENQQQFDRITASGCDYTSGTQVGKTVDSIGTTTWINKTHSSSSSAPKA